MKVYIYFLGILLLLIGCLGNKNSNGSSYSCTIIKEDTLNIHARSILYSTDL